MQTNGEGRPRFAILEVGCRDNERRQPEEKERGWRGRRTGSGLAEVLEDLRAELELARGKAAGTDVQFPVETVTVELKVGVTRSKEGRTGFRVPLVGAELGGSAGIDRDTLQTVTLVLGAPVDRFGDRVKVASASDKLKG